MILGEGTGTSVEGTTEEGTTEEGTTEEGTALMIFVEELSREFTGFLFLDAIFFLYVVVGCWKKYKLFFWGIYSVDEFYFFFGTNPIHKKNKICLHMIHATKFVRFQI